MICPEDIASTPILANDAIFFTVIPPETSSVTFFRTLAFCSTLTAAAAPLGVKLSSNMAVAPHFAAISAERASSTSTWSGQNFSKNHIARSCNHIWCIICCKNIFNGGCNVLFIKKTHPGARRLHGKSWGCNWQITVSGQSRHVLKCERTALKKYFHLGARRLHGEF